MLMPGVGLEWGDEDEVLNTALSDLVNLNHLGNSFEQNPFNLLIALRIMQILLFYCNLYVNWVRCCCCFAASRSD